MAELVKNYIGGKWVDAASGERFDSFNPATEEILASAPKSSREDVDAAAKAAAEAYKSWRLMPAPRRGEILYEFGRLLSERKEEVARLMTQEMGKVLDETRGDVQEAIDMAYYMGGEGRRLFGYTAGNTIVYKPAEETPATAALFVEIFEQAGLPGGVFNLVTGAGETGAALVEHPAVRIISFTGSTETGLKVYTAGARLGKKVSLEMGGKNAIIVMDDANFDLVVDAITWSAYGTTGQRCTATSRLIVQKGIKPKLMDALADKAKTIKLGNGLDPGVEMGPLVNQQALDKVKSYMNIAQDEGVKITVGGEPANMGKGFFFQPTLFDGVKPGMRVEQEEIFGPVLSVIEVDDLDEAVEVNNSVTYGLSSSIFTENVNAVFRAIRDLTTGIVYVNHGTTGAEIHFPFGGTRGTGNGMREAGQAALDNFTEWKSVYVDYSGKLQRAQIDNR